MFTVWDPSFVAVNVSYSSCKPKHDCFLSLKIFIWFIRGHINLAVLLTMFLEI